MIQGIFAEMLEKTYSAISTIVLLMLAMVLVSIADELREAACRARRV